MSTVTVVFAVPTGFVVVGVVVVVLGGGGGATPTPNVPFIPSLAWPGTEHRYASLAFLVNLTVSVAVLPGARIFVRFPAITKLCPIFPRLTTWKTTVVPAGTERLESLKDHSRIVTVIVTRATLFARVLVVLALLAERKIPAMTPSPASTTSAPHLACRRIHIPPH